MIICFEGPSAIGKTTLCELLSNEYCIIPEVNLLFEKEASASKFWYYEKQQARYELAHKANQSAILDGDTFQPIWYNWIYGYPMGFPTKEETHRFYKEQLESGQLQFSDLYIVFKADEKTLRHR